MASAWNPEQYDKFKEERRQPFFDLLALVKPSPRMRVVDLGCGTGELTQVLHRTLGAESTLGIESSETMLAKTAVFAGEGLSFQLGDLAAVPPRAPYDLVFSNAALHWADDHARVLDLWARALGDGGQLAVQMPDNHAHVSHLTAREVGAEEPFRSALSGYERSWPVLDPEEYAAIIHALGFSEQHVCLQVYPHLLPERASVVEWVKGTLLTDYQKRLPPYLFPLFLDRYRERLLPQLPDTRPFFYPFRRLLLWARR